MEKYSIDNKAAEYLKTYAAFQEQLETWQYLFDETILNKTLERISDIIEAAYEINEDAGFVPESVFFSDVEKFSLAVRFDPQGLKIRELKDVPCNIKKEFNMPEEDFKRWLKEEREELDAAFVDMEDLIESIEDDFQTPTELEELIDIIHENLELEDPSYKVLNQFSTNLLSMWEDFTEIARSLVSLSLNINEDAGRAALPAMLYDP
jgi:hypothetical protein